MQYYKHTSNKAIHKENALNFTSFTLTFLLKSFDLWLLFQDPCEC